ncbi:MAG: hypothetical protein LBB78_01875 [Spirochaetaceae bacterium]|jgi:hypothetical protein|nr:hypothetical protein [Spirochaetaceae bacterium]
MKHIFSFFVVAFILFSCRPPVGGDLESTSPSSGYDFPRIFDDFWNGMNRNYVYWDREPGPGWEPVLAQLPTETRDFILAHPASFWDRIYDYYKPQFDKLGTFADTFSPGYSDARDKAIGYFQEMTLGMLDGHFRVYFEGIPGPFFPAQNRFLLKTLNNDPPGANAVFSQSDLSQTNVTIQRDPTKIDLTNLSNNYFGKYDFVNQVLKKYMTIKKQTLVRPSTLPTMLAGPWKLAAGERAHSSGGKIVYLFTNYCYLMDAFDPSSEVYKKASGTQAVINTFFDSLAAQDVKGVIVDVRGNMGGNPADNPFLFGRMIDRPLTFAYSRSKSGEGRLDYSPWMPVRIIPAPATEKRLKNTNIPIALLADRGTFSGAEFHTMIVKSMPNGRVVGETTNGSASNTVNSLIYNGGAFSVGAVVDQVAGSVVQYQCADGNVYEGIGIPPDIDVPMSYAEWVKFFTGQSDRQLEEAIRYIDPGAMLP